MAYPTNDDPDLNKEYKRRGDRPGVGRMDAHQNQTARNPAPQRTSQEDQRQVDPDQGVDARAHKVASGEGGGRTISEQDIATRAHQMWEADGRREGLDRKHWKSAEDELRGRTAGTPEGEP